MSKTLMQDVAIQDVPAPPGWGGGRFMDVLSSSHMLMSSEASVSLGLAHCQALQIHFWCKKELRKDLGSWTPPQKRGMGNTPPNPSFWLSQRSLQDQTVNSSGQAGDRDGDQRGQGCSRLHFIHAFQHGVLQLQDQPPTAPRKGTLGSSADHELEGTWGSPQRCPDAEMRVTPGTTSSSSEELFLFKEPGFAQESALQAPKCC